MHEIEARIGDVLARPATQQPAWPDPDGVADVRDLLARAPELTAPAETDRLRARLADVARGRAFLVQGGDCAETFAGNDEPRVRRTVGTLRRMAGELAAAAGSPVVTVARIAGQYAKPRSSPTDAAGLPSYRGDMVNCAEPDPARRVPDPRRLLRAYQEARATLGMLRRDVFTSHEALVLDYERALLRARPGPGSPVYSAGAHMVWIGERTRDPDGAHVALAGLVANPVGLKLGPAVTPEQAVDYVERLDPHHEPGRLTLVTRMGADRVRDVLPAVVEKVTASGHEVVWQCDPMHGNTVTSAGGLKTRYVDRVADELRGFFAVHHELGTHPGGVHLELTGDDVTECVGGGITDDDLPRRYETACDPRLNARQSAGLTAVVAGEMRRRVPESRPA